MTDLPERAGRPEATGIPEPAEGLVPTYVRRLAWVLDDAIPLVGKRRVGVDGFLSLVPVVGDAAGFGLAAVVVLAGVRAGCSRITIVRMVVHAVGESLAGMIPLAGPAIAFVWKANSRNLAIIERNLADREATRRESWKVLLVGVAMVVLGLAIALLGLVVAIYTIWRWIRG
ncbi:MAG: DUF4112 domain-containing protein [Acidimicrobiales bacterium]